MKISRCPICKTLVSEIRDKNGITYTCMNYICTWSGSRHYFSKSEIEENEKNDSDSGNSWFGFLGGGSKKDDKKKDDKKKKDDDDFIGGWLK